MSDDLDRLIVDMQGRITSLEKQLKLLTRSDRPVLDNFAATTDPGSTDDKTSGYSVGSHWVNNITRFVFVCVDNTTGAAVWLNMTSEFYLEIGRGNIPGMTSYRVPGRKDSISNTVLDDISQIPLTTVIPDPGGIQLRAVSSSGSDTGGGTGVQTLEMVYLNSAGAMLSQTITMAGAVPVNFPEPDVDKVQWISAKAVGSNTVAVGNIQLEDTGGAVIYEYIAAGGNQSLSARFHIPTGKTGYIFGYLPSGITKKIDLRLRGNASRFDRSLTTAFLFQGVVVTNDNSPGWIPYEIPVKMPAMSTVKMSGVSAAAGGDAGVEFAVLLIDD